MNFLWNQVFESTRERRNAAIFICAVVLFIVAFIVGNVLAAFDLWRYWPLILVVIGLCGVVLIWNSIRQMRTWRLNHYKSTPLSRDELAKARSKLRKPATPKKL
ncbi:MAG: hypothetical protein ABSE48_14620 [Verrucomicrobiota bacterium]|jgi:hypothetical protein